MAQNFFPDPIPTSFGNIKDQTKMKTYRILFSGKEYRVTVQKIRSETFYFFVDSIDPDFTLYDRYFRIDETKKSVHFHRSEFHKAIWNEIQKDLDLQLMQVG